MKMETPEQVKQLLIEVFPSFKNEWDPEDACDSMHKVFFMFTPFFGTNRLSFTDKQLTLFSTFINKAVQGTDKLENAVSTCFLEHLNQIESTKVLKPYLSNESKRKTHA